MLNSIKLKLVVLFVVVFSVFFAGLEAFLYYKLDDLVIDLADEHLRSEMQTLANLLAVEEAHGQIESEIVELSAAASGVYSERLSGHYYQISRDDGDMLVRSPSLSLAGASLPHLKGAPRADFRTIAGPGGVPVRMVTQSFSFSIGALTFQAGDSLTDTYELLGSFRDVVLWISPVVFLICGAGVFVAAGWALKSLRDFASKVNEITGENLFERIEEKGAAAELRPLAASFNTMLGRLDESFSRQRRFLSDASHELRTPTSIIKSFCDVTLARERTAGDYRETLVKISETVNRMCEIINRILVISRLDGKAIEFQPSTLDLTETLRDVARLMEPAAANRGVRLGLDGPSIVIRGDREGLMQVFTNMVENAIKYNRPGGSVDVIAGAEGGWATVTVADTGIGIPKEDLSKIFDRFYRVDASRGVTQGSGLGLSIVRTIVESHGGRIEVESIVGKGTTFKVYLPANPDPGADKPGNGGGAARPGAARR
jgi:heavy metal sensor kinase